MIASPFRSRSRRRWSTRDRALVQDVLSTHHGKQRKGRLTALLEDTEFRVVFEYSGSGVLTLSMDCPCLATFAVSRRGLSDNLLSWLPRLRFDPQPLDPEAFTVEARDVATLGPVLGQPDVQAALAALFEAGATRIEHGPKGLVAQLDREQLGEGLDKARLLELVAQLDAVRAPLVELAERQPGRSAPGDMPRRLVRVAPLIAWALALFVAGVTSRQTPLVDGHPPEWADAAFAVAWLGLGTLLGALLLSRRTAPQRALAAPLLALALGCVPAGWATAWWINVAFDRGEHSVVRAPIVDLRQTVRGERVLYHRAAVTTADLGLPDARRDQVWLVLEGMQGELAKEEGATLELALQPGALGAPWIREWRLALH